MRKFLTCVVLVVSGLAAGCAKNPLSPSELPSANGTLPAWMFTNAGIGISPTFSGHLIRPAAGSYGVYLPPDMAADPQMIDQLERVLQAANDLAARGNIRFFRTGDSGAPIKIRGIDPNNSLAPGNLAWGELMVQQDWFTCVGINNMGFKERQYFMNSVLLHEIGHFLFGPRHSDNPGDTMNPYRQDFGRISFSSNEYDIWTRSLQFPPGTTP